MRYETESTYLRLNLPLPPTQITFKELCDEYIASIKGRKAETTERTEKYYLLQLQKTFGDRFIGSITKEEWEAHLYGAGYKPWTFHRMIGTLREVYKLAIDRKYLPRSVIGEIKRPKIGKSIPRFVDPKLLDLVIAEMKGPIRVYYSILRYTGMRPGEALMLRVGDIREITYKAKDGKLAARPVFLFKAPKTGTERVIPIHPNLSVLVFELIKEKKPSDYLFPAKDPAQHQKSMQMGLRRVVAQREAKIKEEAKKKRAQSPSFKGISMYTFRHSVATDMLAKTGDLRAVQTVLGHAKSSTTEIYAHALEAAKIEAIEVL